MNVFFFCCRADEAKSIASKMLGHRLYTKQTGREGKPVTKLIMCEKLFTRREYYFACRNNIFSRFVVSSSVFFLVALERRFDGPVLITSTQGGTNIEDIAAEHPEAIIRHPIDIHKGLTREDALAVAERLEFRDGALEEVFQREFLLYEYVIEFFFSRLLI